MPVGPPCVHGMGVYMDGWMNGEVSCSVGVAGRCAVYVRARGGICLIHRCCWLYGPTWYPTELLSHYPLSYF